MFSKKEMEDEFIRFIEAHLAAEAKKHNLDLSGRKSPRDDYIFQITSLLYDYAFRGEKPQHPQLHFLGMEYPVDGPMADFEMALLGMTRPNQHMHRFNEESEIYPPFMAAKTMQAAVARHVLYGGERYTTPEEFGGVSDCLSFSDVALLADMDEKSVRNAANPKNKDPLITTVNGKRTWITPADALNWLSKRRGFTPTQIND